MGWPNRDDPPPPPPPSFTGFIEDFPWPETFEEYIAMNFIMGALSLWILKLLIRCFRSQKALQKPQILASSPPTLVPIPTPRKTGDRSKTTRYGLPQQRQTPFPAALERSGDPISFYLGFTLASSGSIVFWGLKARHHAPKAKHANLPIVSFAAAGAHSLTNWHQDSNFRYAVLDQPTHPVQNYCLYMLPSSHSPTMKQRQPSVTCRSPTDRVRLSNVNQVKYFYKDEIIGFENGPPARQSLC